MPKANRVCQNCGRAYYVCMSCVKANSYKNLCCSFECFRHLIESRKSKNVITPITINKGRINMQGVLYNNDIIEILGYDLENNKFDCADQQTRTGYEFKNFILDLYELRAIAFDRDKEDADTI